MTKTGWTLDIKTTQHHNTALFSAQQRLGDKCLKPYQVKAMLHETLALATQQRGLPQTLPT